MKVFSRNSLTDTFASLAATTVLQHIQQPYLMLISFCCWY
jgi:hypothetical protein